MLAHLANYWVLLKMVLEVGSRA